VGVTVERDCYIHFFNSSKLFITFVSDIFAVFGIYSFIVGDLLTCAAKVMDKK